MFRIEQNGRMSLGRPKPPTKGGSAPDEEELSTAISISVSIQCYHDVTLNFLQNKSTEMT